MTLPDLNTVVKTGEALPCVAHGTSTKARPRWYAVYTLPRHEKSIAERLASQEVETYLPLYSTIHFWNKRRVIMSLPLFPGYVFVKMLITERVMVLRHPGAIRLVGFNGNATALPDGEVEALRSSLEVHRAEPYPFLTPGKQVQLRSGPLAGLQGTILRRKGKTRLIITLNLIQRAVSFEMDAAEALLTA